MDGERSACMVAKCHSQNCEEATLKAKDCVWQTMIAQVMLVGNGSGAPKRRRWNQLRFNRRLNGKVLFVSKKHGFSPKFLLALCETDPTTAAPRMFGH